MGHSGRDQPMSWVTSRVSRFGTSHYIICKELFCLHQVSGREFIYSPLFWDPRRFEWGHLSVGRICNFAQNFKTSIILLRTNLTFF